MLFYRIVLISLIKKLTAGHLLFFEKSIDAVLYFVFDLHSKFSSREILIIIVIQVTIL